MRNRARMALAAVSASLGLLFGPSWAMAQQDPEPIPQPSETVARLADWVIASGDADNLPFLIVDKVSAQVSAYGAHGFPLGSTPALVGLAQGDESVPGIGERDLSDIRPEERTTPAGRYRARFGPAIGQGGRTLWVDFSTALSLHPVVTTNRKEQRLRRLRSPNPEDNRITYGCINVPADFYEAVVSPAFEAAGGVVYILPDTKSLAEAFPRFGLHADIGSQATMP